jgi:peptide/nickel transport system permease protein
MAVDTNVDLERALTAGVRRPALIRALLHFLLRKPLGAFSLLLILAAIAVAVLTPVLAPYDPEATVGVRLQPPSGAFLFGTDDVGRDILSRLIYGAHVSLEVGFISIVIGIGLGTLLGVVSGYQGGPADLLTQRVVDIWMAFPAILLALSLVSALGVSLKTETIAIGIVIVPSTARVIRSATLSVKESDYVAAARTLGARDGRIVLIHVLPNVMAPVIVLASTSIGAAILAEAGLSFLGLGTPPPTPSWGQMVNEATQGFLTIQPWLTIAPGLCIGAVVLAFNLLGDALRDVLDPRLRSA